MSDLRLYLGDRNRSGWSLPPYLTLQRTAQPFERIGLMVGDENGGTHPDAPGGRVPALAAGGEVVNGALAICEHLAKRFPAAKLWPANAEDQAAGRALAEQATRAFVTLEKELPFQFLGKLRAPQLSEGAKKELAALQQLWAKQRYKYERVGPYLLGTLSIADAMYAPFASRCLTYELKLEKEANAYVQTLLELPALTRWAEAAGLDLAESAQPPAR